MEIRQPAQTRELPNHLRPHVGEKRPFRDEIYRFYRTAERGQRNVPAAFSVLLARISAQQFKPFFDREEIDQLMEREVLSSHEFRGFRGRKDLDLNEWSDLVNAFGQAALASLELIGLGDGAYDRHQLVNYQTGRWRLKIIEDWIHYHPEVQKFIRSRLAGTSSKGT